MREPSWETLMRLPLPTASARLLCPEPCMPAWVSMHCIPPAISKASHASGTTLLSCSVMLPFLRYTDHPTIDCRAMSGTVDRLGLSISWAMRDDGLHCSVSCALSCRCASEGVQLSPVLQYACPPHLTSAYHSRPGQRLGSFSEAQLGQHECQSFPDR